MSSCLRHLNRALAEYYFPYNIGLLLIISDLEKSAIEWYCNRGAGVRAVDRFGKVTEMFQPHNAG